MQHLSKKKMLRKSCQMVITILKDKYQETNARHYTEEAQRKKVILIGTQMETKRSRKSCSRLKRSIRPKATASMTQ
jgi:hypothetical protein